MVGYFLGGGRKDDSPVSLTPSYAHTCSESRSMAVTNASSPPGVIISSTHAWGGPLLAAAVSFSLAPPEWAPTVSSSREPKKGGLHMTKSRVSGAVGSLVRAARMGPGGEGAAGLVRVTAPVEVEGCWGCW